MRVREGASAPGPATGAFPRRADETELLDGPSLPPDELAQSLRHVAAVNRWLGGEASLRRHLAPFRRRSLRLLDVGTGNGTVASRLLRWGGRRGAAWWGVGVDLRHEMLAVARREAPGLPLVRTDALALPFADDSFDVALCTLTLHHFEDGPAARLLSELARVASVLVVVSDLERHPLAYLSARLLAHTWWRRNRLTRSDGPVSVLRSFTAGELEGIGRAAGLTRVSVRRHFPFRLTLVGRR